MDWGVSRIGGPPLFFGGSQVSYHDAKLEKRNGQRARRYQRSRGPYDYAVQDGTRVLELVELLTQMGIAIRLGKSRDMGAAAIGVYGDGDAPYTDFLTPGESLVEYLDDLRGGLLDDQLASTGSVVPPRDGPGRPRAIVVEPGAPLRRNGAVEGQ